MFHKGARLDAWHMKRVLVVSTEIHIGKYAGSSPDSNGRNIARSDDIVCGQNGSSACLHRVDAFGRLHQRPWWSGQLHCR